MRTIIRIYKIYLLDQYFIRLVTHGEWEELMTEN
jgi:hypothetical protein